MQKCPVCGNSHDGPENLRAISVESPDKMLDLGAVCSLDCAVKRIMELDSSDKCPGCPNCQPMKFMRPSGITS